MSNQKRLGNGCVCDSGCEACDRLAEAFEAMRIVLEGISLDSDYALALADKVTP